MKALALVVAVAVTLVASGCVNKQEPVSNAMVGAGTVPKTRLIMARPIRSGRAVWTRLATLS
jgi:hypothetical protein